MGGCCSGGESYDDEFAGGEEWAQWDKHPARQHYDVFDEIGEGAFSKVTPHAIQLRQSPPPPLLDPCLPLDGIWNVLKSHAIAWSL